MRSAGEKGFRVAVTIMMVFVIIISMLIEWCSSICQVFDPRLKDDHGRFLYATLGAVLRGLGFVVVTIVPFAVKLCP